MNEINGVNLHFNWKFDEDLSDKAKSYIHSLEMQNSVDVYIEVLEEFQPNEVGWALIPERKVYIRPTEEIKEFELRLVHELTHIAMADEGYGLIGCYEGDTLCYAFANLLHHLVLYQRLVSWGFSLEIDTNMVMDRLTENLQSYKNVSDENGPDGMAYAIINVMNDLIRLDTSRKGDYLAEATKHIPNLLQQAQNLLVQIEKSSPSPEDYRQCKAFLEKELGLGSEFSWLE